MKNYFIPYFFRVTVFSGTHCILTTGIFNLGNNPPTPGTRKRKWSSNKPKSSVVITTDSLKVCITFYVFDTRHVVHLHKTLGYFTSK